MIHYLSVLMWWLAIWFNIQWANYIWVTAIINSRWDIWLPELYTLSGFMFWLIIICFWLLVPVWFLSEQIKQLKYKEKQKSSEEVCADKIRYFISKKLNNEFTLYDSFDLPELLIYFELEGRKYSLTNTIDFKESSQPTKTIKQKTYLIIQCYPDIDSCDERSESIVHLEYDVDGRLEDQSFHTLHQLMKYLGMRLDTND